MKNVQRDAATLRSGKSAGHRRQASAIFDSSNHVHIGAGKLGLGLIVSALAEDDSRSLTILEVPSPEWEPLFKTSRGTETGKQVKLMVNNKDVATLNVVVTKEQYEQRVKEADETQEPTRMLIITKDDELKGLVAKRATSASTALGPFLEVALTSFLKVGGLMEKETDQGIIVYGCENDHKMVETLAEKLKMYCRLVPVLVDRICSDRKIGRNTISIEAESYEGEIIVKMPGDDDADGEDDFDAKDDSPWDAADNVTVVDRTDMWAFFRQKKILTVNGLHTTLAFLTLDTYERPDHMGLPKGDHKLITYATATDEQKRIISSWVIARVLMIMDEFPLELIFDALRDDQKKDDVDVEEFCVEKLANYAFTARDRISKMDDTTSRILSGGVVNRFNTRLVGVNEFLQAKAELTSADRKALKYMKGDEKMIRDDVADLCERAGRFAVHKVGKDTKTSVIFDFDGTLCNSERPRMLATYAVLAPYLLMHHCDEAIMEAFVRNNSGKAFELLNEAVNERRAQEGLDTIEKVRAEKAEDPAMLKMVDEIRTKLGLVTFAEMRSEGSQYVEPASLYVQHKKDLLIAIGRFANYTDGALETLNILKEKGYSCCVATTASKPRVSVSVDAIGLTEFFPEEKIHSGKSDFHPPRFKPQPHVYLRAALHEGLEPSECVAIEDTVSGVASCSNAKIGLIVGYVGGSHIDEKLKEDQAMRMLSGARSKSRRGANIVIQNMSDLPALVDAFNAWLVEDEEKRGKFFNAKTDAVTKGLKGPFWLYSNIY
eukprot:CAMPEP_0184719728 /NCGR_PEP_ID=MMETSP0314-20130426/9355_1 /TAXON_ID=38298 /ORGANISM="Rhodella maculata, Strain CCMP 736" /LENGTH=773 /DNA_ID=CAMNT_0027183655 /DNA_START=78 /DNA_END=2399 /DNA_ORIENTATION=+